MNRRTFEHERRPPITLRKLATAMGESSQAPKELAKQFGVSEATIYAWLRWYETHDRKNEWFQNRPLERFEIEFIAKLRRKGSTFRNLQEVHGYWKKHVLEVDEMIKRGEV